MVVCMLKECDYLGFVAVKRHGILGNEQKK